MSDGVRQVSDGVKKVSCVVRKVSDGVSKQDMTGSWPRLKVKLKKQKPRTVPA